jgi:hypothetical protein
VLPIPEGMAEDIPGIMPAFAEDGNAELFVMLEAPG